MERIFRLHLSNIPNCLARSERSYNAVVLMDTVQGIEKSAASSWLVRPTFRTLSGSLGLMLVVRMYSTPVLHCSHVLPANQ
jgi:hypothetical protein